MRDCRCAGSCEGSCEGSRDACSHRRLDEIANEITALRLDVLREDEVPVEDQLVPVGKMDAVLSTCMRAPGSRAFHIGHLSISCHHEAL